MRYAKECAPIARSFEVTGHAHFKVNERPYPALRYSEKG